MIDKKLISYNDLLNFFEDYLWSFQKGSEENLASCLWREIGKETIKQDVKIWCGFCCKLIQENIGEDININSGLFETEVAYPNHKCKND